jgi:catechol-2,3-dioxygenase
MSTTQHPASSRSIARGICEITLQARDLARLEAFYRDLLGCQTISREDDRIWLACGSHARLGIWSPGRKEFGDRGGRHVHFALSVGRGELAAVSERLERIGIEHQGPEQHSGGDRSLYVEDPEGNVVELWDFFERGDGAREGVAALA